MVLESEVKCTSRPICFPSKPEIRIQASIRLLVASLFKALYRAYNYCWFIIYFLRYPPLAMAKTIDDLILLNCVKIYACNFTNRKEMYSLYFSSNKSENQFR